MFFSLRNLIYLVVLIFLYFLYKNLNGGLETFLPNISFYTHLKNVKENDKSYLVEKIKLDSLSSNNVLTFTKNTKCDIIKDDGVNHDCGLNPQYLHSMCLNKRSNDKKRLCNSLVDIVQRPQDTNNPGDFIEF